MKKKFLLVLCLASILFLSPSVLAAKVKKIISALYIPLADHYPGLVAYEKYKDKMQHADYQIERMKNWDLLRAKFMSGEVDMAFIISPMAMDIFLENPNFRWISLLHRDGNALAINELLNKTVQLPKDRIKRKPDARVAEAFTAAKNQHGQPSQCGVPSLYSTHTVVLYKYLNDYNKTLALGFGKKEDVIAIAVAPAKSPAFIKKNNSRGGTRLI